MSVPTERLERPRWPAVLTAFASDRVVIALGVGLLALAIVDADQVVPTLAFTGRSLLDALVLLDGGAGAAHGSANEPLLLQRR